MIPDSNAPQRAWRAGLARLFLILVLAGVCAMPLAAQDSVAPTGQLPPPSAPVVLDGETLFFVRGASSYPAEKRAAEGAAAGD